NTAFSRLLIRAKWLESQLQKNSAISLQEFGEVNKISPRYVRSVLTMNKLSPKIQAMIMDGYMPRHLSIQDIISKKFPILWKEQEKIFVK
ncbi:MAG: hypothetical protein LBB34_00545, partial [Holosporales bacterium]|nr:hypothetical protein [Holosporales bacterium]